MKQYRIGDFARYLGVTPDLLKHYEEVGLLQPERTESGYRYYPFHTTALLIECVRLRNYGMTLREIREILIRRSVESAQVEKRLSDNVSHLRQEARLDTLLAEDYDAFLTWRAPLDTAEYDWAVHWSRPMLFLPHTDGYDFLEDGRIYDLLKDWMSYIPIVKSSMKVERSGRVTWGFVVPEETLERLQLPVNAVVERVPSQKVFYYKFRSSLALMQAEGIDAEMHPAFRLMRSMNIAPGDTYYRTTLLPAAWEQGIQCQYGYYAIPIRAVGQGDGA